MADESSKPRRRLKTKKGLVIVNTGKGKGKTTAALGMMLRAWGRGMQVAVIQFLKHKGARYGEIKAAEKMGIEIIPTGDGWTFDKEDMSKSIELSQDAWRMVQARILAGEDDVLILDEFTYPLHFEWLNVNEVIDWLRENKPAHLHLVITGRDAPAELIEFADLVSEIQEIKHPFNEQGIKGQPGVEY
jgi:cob(I)alamin adenosyltransferase